MNLTWIILIVAYLAAGPSTVLEVPDPRFGKVEWACPIPDFLEESLGKDHDGKKFFAGYGTIEGYEHLHVIAYLSRADLLSTEFYYHNDYSSRPILLGLVQSEGGQLYTYWRYEGAIFIQVIDEQELFEWITMRAETRDADRVGR